MHSVVPPGPLALHTPGELQELVCGHVTVDLTLLRRMTTYKGTLTEASPVVGRLWKALESFSHDERSLFLRWVDACVRVCACVRARVCACVRVCALACTTLCVLLRMGVSWCSLPVAT